MIWIYGIYITKEIAKRWKLLPLDLEDRGKDIRDGIVGAFCDISCRAVLNLCPGTSDTS